MTTNKNDDFHQPFIKNLVLVAFFTIGSMILGRYLVDYYMDHNIKTPSFPSSKSQYTIDRP